MKKARKTPTQESQVLDDVQTLWEKTQEPKMLETDSFVSRFPVDHVNNTEENLLFDDAKSSSKQDQNCVSKSEFDFEDLDTRRAVKPPLRTYSLKDKKNARKFNAGKSRDADKCLNCERKKNDEVLSEIPSESLDRRNIQPSSRISNKNDRNMKNESQLKGTNLSTKDSNKNEKHKKRTSVQNQGLIEFCDGVPLKRTSSCNTELPLNFSGRTNEVTCEHNANKNHQNENFTKLISSQVTENDDVKEEKENISAPPRRRKRRSVESSQQTYRPSNVTEKESAVIPATGLTNFI